MVQYWTVQNLGQFPILEIVTKSVKFADDLFSPKALDTTAADNINSFSFFFLFFSEKIGLDVSRESSARFS